MSRDATGTRERRDPPVPSPRARSWLDFVGIVAGALGILVGLAALILVWIVSARLRDGIDVLFDQAYGSLDLVSQRLVQTRDRIDGATQSADALEATLRAELESRQQVAWRARAAERVDRLAPAVAQADRWLEGAESAVSLVRDRVLLSASTGVSPDTAPLDQLLERITALRLQLRQVEDSIGQIRERLAGTDDAESRDTRSTTETRSAAVQQLAERVMTGLESVQSGLDGMSNRAAAAQIRLKEYVSGTKRQIRLITWGVVLLLVWMGAGQVALCRLAWRRPRRESRSGRIGAQ